MKNTRHFLYGYVESIQLDPEVEKNMFDFWNQRLGDSTKEKVTVGYRVNNKEFSTRMCKIDNELHRGYTYNVLDVSEQVLPWAKKNLSQKIFDVRLGQSLEGDEILGSHIDTTRDFVILYPIKSGGKYAETCFYFDKSKGDILPGKNSKELESVYQTDYDLLETVARVKIPTRRWLVMNAKVLHGVENMTESRCVVQASLDDISGLNIRHPVYYESVK